MLHPYPSSYTIEKVGDSSYPYLYPVNVEILRQNGDQYPQEQIYLSSLLIYKVQTTILVIYC